MAVAITQTANPAGVAATATVATYSSVSIGTAASDRIVAVVVATELASSTPNVVTIDSGGGAETMRSATTGSFGSMFARVFFLPVSTGTTATITVKFSAVSPGSTANHIAVYAVTGASGVLSAQGGDGSTDMDATDPLTTGSVTIPTDGGFLAVACGATDTVAKTWANATEDLDGDAGTFRFTTATRTTSGTVTITCTGATNGEDGALSYVIFAPGTPSITDGIVAYWKLDESSGDAVDSVSSFTLTNTNTVAYAAAKINNGADFGSANTNKRLLSSSDLGVVGTAPQSFSFWLNPNALPTSGNEWRVFDHRDAGTGVMNTFRLFNEAGTQKLEWLYSQNGTADTRVSKTQTLSTGTWYHIAYVYDGVNITGYVNATAEAKVAASGTGSGISDGMCIGSTANGFLFGSVIIDEAGYWNRILSNAEVTTLYNSGTGLQYPFTPPASDTSYIASMARMVQAGVGF